MATSALAKYITGSLKPWAYLYTKASHKNNDNNGPAPVSALTACPLRADVGTASFLPSAGSRWGRAAHAAEEAQERATEMCSRGWQTGTSWGREAFMGAEAVPGVPPYSLNSIWSWAGQP